MLSELACSVALITTSLFVSDAIADEKSPRTNVALGGSETRHFLLHPAAPPYAAFKCRLLPSCDEQFSGNALPQYVRAALFWSHEKSYVAALPKIDAWIDSPCTQLSKNAEAQEFYNHCSSSSWELIRLAAYSDACQWNLPLGEYDRPSIMPEISDLKIVCDLGNLVAFKAHVEISRGQFGDAMESLKMGLALAHHVGDGPTLINATAAIRLASQMIIQLEDVVQQPECPNLYWSLAVLPEPFIDLRSGMKSERMLLYSFVPGLRDVRTARRNAAEWDALLLQVVDKLKTLSRFREPPDYSRNSLWFTVTADFSSKAYPMACEQLELAGYTQSQIKAMSTSQAILVATVETYEHLQDELNRCFFAQWPDLYQQLAGFDDELRTTPEVIPLAKILLPAVRNARFKQLFCQQKLAALRCVEAIRFFAAEHHNQLPGQLSDTLEVPIPNDPMTGQPFAYQFSGGEAVVTSPAPPSEPASQGLSWTIQIAPADRK